MRNFPSGEGRGIFTTLYIEYMLQDPCKERIAFTNTEIKRDRTRQNMPKGRHT